MNRAVFVLLAFVFLGLAQEPAPTEAFTLKVTGQKTWGVRLGFGDPALLSLERLGSGGLTLTQSLWAQIEGKVLDFLTLRASFNDQLGPGFQDFLVIVDRKPWYAELGRFVVGGEGDALGVYNKRVLGARVSLGREGVNLSGLVARLEGISESLVFRGEVVQAERTFAYEDPKQPWLPAPYLLSLDGLYAFPLRLPFVEGFSKPAFRFPTDAAFQKFLADWGLEYLFELVQKRPSWELPAGAYLVVQDEAPFLLLRQEPKGILRNRILDLLDQYNAAHGLTGKDKKSYPFIQESDLEAAFLAALAGRTSLVVDEEAYPLAQAQRRRFLYLGEPGIRAEDFSLAVRLPGEADFRDLADPALAQFRYKLFAAEGVVRLDFPADFFRPGAAVRASFAYARAAGVYFLGLSVLPGSERVYLNDALLARDTDYTIDYEVGLLTLLRSVGPEDVVRVDFERQRGALGVPVEYERYFLGATLAWGSARIGVYQAADVGAPTPTSRTMPNTHSVLALSWQGEVGGWRYSARLGFSENVFPPDLGERIPARNRIHAIAPVQLAEGEAVVFAHRNGITVYQSGRFASYGSAQGLAGQAALALLPLPGRLLIGTDAGLTVVDVAEPGALDRVRSWTRLYANDWNKNRTERIAGTRILALAREGEHVFLATEAEVLVSALAEVGQPERWTRLPLPEGTPRALLWAGELYLGTSAGLFRLRGNAWETLLLGEVFALLGRASEVFVATGEGVRILRDGQGAGWLAYGEPVRALALWEDRVWYATPSGVFREGERALAGDFVALGVAGEALWAGTAADENFQLDLWRVAPAPQRFPQGQTKIDGRDLTSFSDPPREGRVRLGPAASLALSRKLGDWEWQLGVHSQFPGYEEIGYASRTDAHGFSFSGQYAKGAWSLAVRGRADLAELTAQPTLRLSGGLEGSWKGPCHLAFRLSPVLSPSGRTPGLGLDFAASLSAPGNPGWSASASGKLALPEFHLAGTLGGRVSYSPWPGFGLDLAWSRPYRSRGAPGTETLALSARLSGGDGFAWSAAWEERFSRSVGEPRWTQTRTLSGELRPPARALPGGKVAARILGALEMDPAERRLRGNLSANAELSPHALQLSLGAEQSVRPALERTATTLSLSASWSHSGWPDVRPSLTYKRSWKILAHPRYPPQVSEDQGVEGRVSWERGGGDRHELSLTWSPREGLRMQERGVWRTPWGPLQVESALTWTGERFTGRVRAEAGLTLAPQWGLNVEAGLLFGGGPLRFAGFLGATLVATF
ncbi:MAG: hypothetical protein N2507_01485 [Candidatus Bipolaricaulota bacterium]|nr:hypothetical protein [Candidatus Bipolaricaulota bacterium]